MSGRKQEKQYKEGLPCNNNYRNKGTLTFHLKGERVITVASVAMDFARMAGVMETLGNIPDNSYYRHKMDLYCWAEEFVHDQETKGAVIFFEKK